MRRYLLGGCTVGLFIVVIVTGLIMRLHHGTEVSLYVTRVASPLSAQNPFEECSSHRRQTALPDVVFEPSASVPPMSMSGNAHSPVAVWMQGNPTQIVGRREDGLAKGNTAFRVPFTRCGGAGPGFAIASDPWVSAGPDGRLFAVGIGSTLPRRHRRDVRAAVLVSSSKDGGKSWTMPHILEMDETDVGSLSHVDRPSVAADPKIAGYAYAVWTGVLPSGDSAIMFSRTTNGGRSWMPAETLSNNLPDGGLVTDHHLLVSARTGTIFDVYSSYSNDGYVAHGRKCVLGGKNCHEVVRRFASRASIDCIRSQDGGLTWSEPIRVNDLLRVGVPSYIHARLRTGDGLDADMDEATGSLYVAWTDGRFAGFSHDDVLMARSVDDGISWSSPTMVSDGSPSFIPSIAVNVNDTVGLGYYTMESNGKDGRQDIPVYYKFALVRGGAMVVADRIRLYGPFDMAVAPLAAGRFGGYFLGDYGRVVARGPVFSAFFVVTTGESAAPTRLMSGDITQVK